MFTDSKQTFHLPRSDNTIYLGGVDQAWPPIPVRQQEHLMTVRSEQADLTLFGVWIPCLHFLEAFWWKPISVQEL